VTTPGFQFTCFSNRFGRTGVPELRGGVGQLDHVIRREVGAVGLGFVLLGKGPQLQDVTEPPNLQGEGGVETGGRGGGS